MSSRESRIRSLEQYQERASAPTGAEYFAAHRRVVVQLKEYLVAAIDDRAAARIALHHNEAYKADVDLMRRFDEARGYVPERVDREQLVNEIHRRLDGVRAR